MSQNKAPVTTFLKELNAEVEKILSDSEHIVFLAEQLYKRYDQWIEENPDISRSESFKNLEKDIRALYQTSTFMSQDCVDVRHSIAQCLVELN
jgi:hypothetical protein